MNFNLKKNFGHAVVLVCSFVGQLALAGPMGTEEFFQLIKGDYKVSKPASQATRLEDGTVTVFMKEGKIFLKNNLPVNTKSRPALYKVTSFECYNHAVPSSGCDFQLGLENAGDFIHFLGITPQVRVDRFKPAEIKLEVKPGIYRAEAKYGALEQTVLQKQ